MKKLIVLFCVLASGCSTTMSLSDCQTADWEKVGYVDGSHGQPESHLDRHIYTCRGSGAGIDAIAYTKGRDKGLREYCTAEGLYSAGMRGEAYQEACDSSIRHFWSDGRDHFELMNQRAQAEKALETRQKELDDDHSVIGDLAKGYHILSGTSQTQDEQDRVHAIDDKIYDNERLAPAGSHFASNAIYGDAETQSRMTKAVVGVMGVGVGAVVGFGLGHTIVGDYRQDGWKFTVLDSAAIAGLAAAAHNCPSPAPGSNESQRSGCGLATAAGVLAFIGIRVWEVGSIVTHVNHPDYKSTDLTLVPVGDTVGLGTVASF